MYLIIYAFFFSIKVFFEVVPPVLSQAFLSFSRNLQKQREKSAEKKTARKSEAAPLHGALTSATSE